MIYKCEICYKEFIDRYHYDRHKNNKKGCKLKENIEFKCDYCSKYFSLKKTLDRHQTKGYCKNYNKLMKENNNKLKEIIKNITGNNDVEKYIGNLNNMYKPVFKNIQSIQNTQNIQIVVNPFGKEENIPIPDDIYFEAIKNLIKGIPLLIKYIHFNVKYPQNKNINGKGLSSKYIEVHDGDDWIIDNKKNIIFKLIIDKKDKLDDFIDDQVEKNKISKKFANRYEKQTEKLDEYLNEDFRGEKASEESVNFFKELEEEVNMTIENEKNKAKRKKKILD
jgi:hypothetical protein